MAHTGRIRPKGDPFSGLQNDRDFMSFGIRNGCEICHLGIFKAPYIETVRANALYACIILVFCNIVSF